jgi:hypothetical protein
MPTPAEPLAHILELLTTEFTRLERLGAKAIAQVPSDEALNAALDQESNSIVVIVRHLAGNMRSRWTDFLTSDGEKPSRDRDGEFDPAVALTREALLAEWESGWAATFGAVRALQPADLLRTVTIRSEELSVAEALTRQVAHYAQHVGQIVLLAKHHAGPAWTSLSIPRGQSTAKQWSYRAYGR